MPKRLAAIEYGEEGTRLQELDQAYTFQGKIYGPGQAEVPDSFPTKEDLDERAALKRAKKAGRDALTVGSQRKTTPVPEPEPEE